MDWLDGRYLGCSVGGYSGHTWRWDSLEEVKFSGFQRGRLPSGLPSEYDGR